MRKRVNRLADEIRDILGCCFAMGQVEDPRLQGVSITHVKLTTDLRNAKVYYRIMSDEEVLTSVDQCLAKCSGYFRTQIATRLRSKRVPQLQFVFDKSVDYGARIEKLIQTI